MPKAIEIMLEEHRIIESVIGSLESFITWRHDDSQKDRETLADFSDFFQKYADESHHKKEEDRLFVAMTKHGFRNGNGALFQDGYGLITAMLAEHKVSRSHIAKLAEIGAGKGPLTAEERDTAEKHARAYAALLRAHIQRENDILLPMAAKVIPPDLLDRLGDDFARMVEEEGPEYRKMAARLSTWPGATPARPGSW